MYYGVFAIKSCYLKVFTTGIWPDVEDVFDKLAKWTVEYHIRDSEGKLIDTDYIKEHIKDNWGRIHFKNPYEGYIIINN